jgi:lysozyme
MRIDVDLAIKVASELIKHFEGFYATSYLCPANVPTIGYGTTVYPDGTKVTLKDPAITLDRATELLTHMVWTVYLPQVLRMCPGIDTPQRLAALVDLCYNIGGGNLSASTLRKKVNAGDWEAARRELAKWVRGGGRVLPGLVRRRAAEAKLF